MTADTFVVRVNRHLLFVLALIGALFFAVGLDAVFFRSLLDWHFSSDKWLLYCAAVFFFLVCGCLVAINCLWYFLFPPVMLRFDANGVTVRGSSWSAPGGNQQRPRGVGGRRSVPDCRLTASPGARRRPSPPCGANGAAAHAGAAGHARPEEGVVVSPLGFEPRTKGLKVPCSTAELRAHW